MRDNLILLAWSYKANSVHHLDKYLEGYSTIQFVTHIRGALRVVYDEEEWLLRDANWFFPAHPGPRLRFGPGKPGDDWCHRHVAFQGPLLEGWKAAGLWPERPQVAPPGRDWEAFFHYLHELYGRTDRFARLKAINGLETMLLELAEARASQGEREPQPWLEHVLNLLSAQEAGQRPPLEEIAASIGWSSTELRRRFKAATGITMQEHVLQGRLAAARGLLLDTDLPLKAIAHQLGYANEFFFSRQFKERTGVAPGAWRQSR